MNNEDGEEEGNDDGFLRIATKNKRKILSTL
jgi:hypothetical protein